MIKRTGTVLNGSGIPRSAASVLAAIMIAGLAFLFAPVVTGACAADSPAGITVVDDKAYPPFAFIDGNGDPCGIIIDIWKLWSRKTGIPVSFRLMVWDAALAEVRQGRADVVGGLFRTPDRESAFDFSDKILAIPTAIFFFMNKSPASSISPIFQDSG